MADLMMDETGPHTGGCEHSRISCPDGRKRQMSLQMKDTRAGSDSAND